MTIVLAGDKMAQTLQVELTEKIKQKNLSPKVMSLSFQEEPSFLFNRRKKIAEKLTIDYQFETVTAETVWTRLDELNANDDWSGIIFDGELPKTLNEWDLRLAMEPEKDMEGFHPINQAKLFMGKSGWVPSTPLAIVYLLEQTNISLEGKNVVVVGRGNLVGRPLAQLLIRHNATVTVVHSKTKALENFTQQADILFAAVGQAKMIQGSMIKKEAVVIDIGMSYDTDGKLAGDVDNDSVIGKASYLSPLKGGIAPLGVMLLMKQLIDKIE